MTWDEAYCEMKAGAAIARPGWTGIHYLFWEREMVWAFHSSGRVQCYQHYFQRAAGKETDWYIVTDVSKPPAPVEKPKRGGERSFLIGLAAKQAEMRGRWMNKPIFEALGKIFAAEIEDRLPFQSKAKIFKSLVDDGMVEGVTVTLPGRFPGRFTGYVLTPRGHVLYCEACSQKAGPLPSSSPTKP